MIEGFNNGTTAWTRSMGTPIYSKEEHTRLFGEYAEHMPGYEEPGLLDDVYTYFEDDEKILDEMYTRYGGVS